jgi:hypothetical protein
MYEEHHAAAAENLRNVGIASALFPHAPISLACDVGEGYASARAAYVGQVHTDQLVAADSGSFLHPRIAPPCSDSIEMCNITGKQVLEAQDRVDVALGH